MKSGRLADVYQGGRNHDGVYHGQGHLWLRWNHSDNLDPCQYSGAWVNGLKHGKGFLTYDNEVYEGSSSGMNGMGIEMNAKPRLRYLNSSDIETKQNCLFPNTQIKTF